MRLPYVLTTLTQKDRQEVLGQQPNTGMLAGVRLRSVKQSCCVQLAALLAAWWVATGPRMAHKQYLHSKRVLCSCPGLWPRPLLSSGEEIHRPVVFNTLSFWLNQPCVMFHIYLVPSPKFDLLPSCLLSFASFLRLELMHFYLQQKVEMHRCTGTDGQQRKRWRRERMGGVSEQNVAR